MLSCCLVTAAVHCRKFCWNLLKSRVRLFTNNDLWSRFEELHLWYSKLVPKHTSNFSPKPSHSYSYKGLFCFWASDQPVLLTHLLNSWAEFSKEPVLALSQEASGLASSARRKRQWCWCLRARWELTPQRAWKKQGSALTCLWQKEAWSLLSHGVLCKFSENEVMPGCSSF